MGGFYIRFNEDLSKEDLQTIIRKAKLRTVEVVKNGDGFDVYMLFIGRHWWVAVNVYQQTETEYESIYFCVKEEDEECMRELEEMLRPKWLFPMRECHEIDLVATQDGFNPNRFELRWICHEVRRRALFNVEINTNFVEQHDVEILKIVARYTAGLDVSTVVRPM